MCIRDRAKAADVKSETGFNKVTLFWPVPKDPSVRSARIYWDKDVYKRQIIGDGVRKQVGHILVNFIQVKVFQTFIAHQMKQYHDGYHLGIGQRAVTVSCV